MKIQYNLVVTLNFKRDVIETVTFSIENFVIKSKYMQNAQINVYKTQRIIFKPGSLNIKAQLSRRFKLLSEL